MLQNIYKGGFSKQWRLYFYLKCPKIEFSQFRFFDCLKTGNVLWIRNAPLFYIRNIGNAYFPNLRIRWGKWYILNISSWVKMSRSKYIKHVTSFLTENTKYKIPSILVYLKLKWKLHRLKNPPSHTFWGISLSLPP